MRDGSPICGNGSPHEPHDVTLFDNGVPHKERCKGRKPKPPTPGKWS